MLFMPVTAPAVMEEMVATMETATAEKIVLVSNRFTRCLYFPVCAYFCARSTVILAVYGLQPS